MKAAHRLRELLAKPGFVEAPGCYDALSARLVEQAGFAAGYVTGFGAAASRLGAPDAGLLTGSEMAEHVRGVAEAVSLPLVADADTGYGNPVNVQRTVAAFARAGAAAVQIEDQVWPKRCGHTRGKAVVAHAEAVQRVRAAADACQEHGVLLVARTDARAPLGLDAAIERCRAFVEVGADLIFLEAPASAGEVAALADAVRAPLVLNVLEGGLTPVIPRAALAELGVKLVIYPLTLLFVAASAVRSHLARPGGFQAWDGALDFSALQEIVGFPAYDRQVRRYDSQPSGDAPPAAH